MSILRHDLYLFNVSKEGCYPLILGLGVRTCRPIYSCKCARVFVKIKSNLMNNSVTCMVPISEVCMPSCIDVLQRRQQTTALHYIKRVI